MGGRWPRQVFDAGSAQASSVWVGSRAGAKVAGAAGSPSATSRLRTRVGSAANATTLRRPFSMKLSNGYPLKRKQKPDGTKVKWKISDEAIVRVPMPRTTYLEREASVAQLVTAQLKEKP